ncbi:MAG: hypothetical protein HZB76_05540 [Chlamydiae bacterium]|nr:hypothetical protein [Chlamydiota bacterium]
MIVYNRSAFGSGLFSSSMQEVVNPIAIIAIAAISLSLAIFMRCLKNHHPNALVKAHRLQTAKPAAASVSDIIYYPRQIEELRPQQQALPQELELTTISAESSAASPAVRTQSEPISIDVIEIRAIKIIHKHLLSPRTLLLDSDFYTACNRLNIQAANVVDLIKRHKILNRIKKFQDMLNDNQKRLFLQISKKGNSF